MSRRPRVTGPALMVALSNAGFGVVRIKGSHHFLGHEDGRSTVVPVHSGETIDRDCCTKSFAIVS